MHKFEFTPDDLFIKRLKTYAEYNVFIYQSRMSINRGVQPNGSGGLVVYDINSNRSGANKIYPFVETGSLKNVFKKYKYQPINLKLWEGEDLNKKILIVYSEGGIGDTIHFARYIKNLKERYSVKIYLKIDKRIKHLFKSLGISFIDEESEIPKSDYYCLIMSLAKIHFDKFFKVLEQNYKIANDVNISLAWGKKLEKIKNPRIGVCWKGNKNNKNDFFRSIKYITLSKLFKLEEINFISLQQYIELDELEKINKV